jgi:putative spermidine/putrescine transport system permease protein
MQLSGSSRWLLRLGTAVTLAFLYLPLLVILVYAFNSTRVQKWPPAGLTFSWFDRALHNPGVRDALGASGKFVLGTMASIAVARYRFFGREAVSFLVVLPIALPGIVTGMALNSTFTQVLGVSLGLLTIVIGHATFCIVVVFNNVVARLRRTSTSFEEASADLGANGLQTFRYVVFPQLRSALVAGALLAFALSFDEIIVTTFTAGQQQTLPIWIFANLSRPRQLPIVNVVAVLAILLSLIPVWIAQRITADPVTAGAARAEAGGEAGA